ncbi:hypothetical protein [Ancrocorticia populi]|uniref:hypothetical protein n=1 Tax=Ancrocorticia populi TaxID=2175228 RepID=UPI003F969978
MSSVPSGDTSRGLEAVALAKFYNAGLYPWQEELLVDMGADVTESVDGEELTLPAAREVVVPLARQNGKGEVLVWREISGIYLWGEKVILHTAHLMDTAQDAMRRLWSVIEDNPDLMYWWEDEYDELPQKIESNGKECIRFPNGAVIYFRTRTIKTGRGLSVDLLVFDECFNLPLEVFAAMNATTRARQRSQKIFISSPVNRRRHIHGRVFSGKRWQGIDGASGVLYKEWSPAPDSDPHDLETWKMSNPSLVTRGPGVQLAELEADSAAAKNSADLLEVFLVEALGQGDWYPRDGEVEEREHVIDLDVLDRAVKSGPPQSGDCCLGADCPPGGDSVAVWSAFRTAYGAHLTRAPISEMDRQVVGKLILKNVEKSDPVGVVYDPKTAVDSITPLLEKGGIDPVRIGINALATAGEMITSGISDGTVTWDGAPEFRQAVEAAEWREVGDAGRAFSRRHGVIHDLVAASLALWGLEKFEIPGIDPAELEKHIPVPIGGAVTDDNPTVTRIDEECMYV